MGAPGRCISNQVSLTPIPPIEANGPSAGDKGPSQPGDAGCMGPATPPTAAFLYRDGAGRRLSGTARALRALTHPLAGGRAAALSLAASGR
jgi:hypothetical protein